MYGTGKHQSSTWFSIKMAKTFLPQEKITPVKEVSKGNILNVEERKKQGMCLLLT